MALETTTASSLISPNAKSPVNVRARSIALRQRGGLGIDVADAVDQLQDQLDPLRTALQQPIPMPDEIAITDPVTGELVAWIGYRVGADGTVYKGGYFEQLYVGPGGDPSKAIFYSDGNSVRIGKNGWISVMDPFDHVAAWIGTQSDLPMTVTGAASASGLIRLTTAVPHNFTAGDQVDVNNVGGVPNATGQWLITIPDTTHIDLVGSTWGGGYTSGGTVQRYFAGAAFEQLAVGGATRITNAVDNGSGLVRITSTGHRLQTGWFATVTGVGGVPNANGYWYVTRIDADTVDLEGSVFDGTYTSGGSIFSWPSAKLRAQPNGDLVITDAKISITQGPRTIVIDPADTTGGIRITNLSSQQMGVFNEFASTFFATDINGVPISGGALAQYGLSGLTMVNSLSSTTATLLAADGTLVVKGIMSSHKVEIDGVVVIDDDLTAKNLASVDSALYKASGTNGVTAAASLVAGLTVNTGPVVTGVTGTGISVSTGTAVTSISVTTFTNLVVTGGIVTTLA